MFVHVTRMGSSVYQHVETVEENNSEQIIVDQKTLESDAEDIMNDLL